MLTGCPPSEARAFRREDIRHDHILFAVAFGPREELKEVNGKKIMPFPLTEGLKQLFQETPKNLSPFVFISPRTGKPYTKNINRIFNHAAKKAGLDVSLNEFGRKSFAMQVLGAGIDKAVVSHLLRHQDPRMIDHYAEYQTQPLKSVLDKVQSLDTICMSPDRKMT
jgi:integrase